MQIVMKKQTRWNGAALTPGDTADIEDKTALRWINHGIAAPAEVNPAGTFETTTAPIGQGEQISGETVDGDVLPPVAAAPQAKKTPAASRTKKLSHVASRAEKRASGGADIEG